MAAPYNGRMVNHIIREAVQKQGRGGQAQLARALDTTPQTINKWMRDQVSPEPWRWPLIEHALQLDDGVLAAASGTPVPPATLLDRLDDIERRLAELEGSGARAGLRLAAEGDPEAAARSLEPKRRRARPRPPTSR